MTTAVSAAALVALIAARVSRPLRVAPRRTMPPPSGRRRGRRPAPTNEHYAALLTAVARQVRSGASLTSALLDEIDPTIALGDLATRLVAGASLAEALAGFQPDDADAALTVQALSASAHLGGPVAATLDEAAAVLRERAAARAERAAHSSQARLSARVLTIVPVGFALWTAITSQRTRDVYLASVAGGVCAVCGLLLNVLGWQWMRRTIGPR